MSDHDDDGTNEQVADRKVIEYGSEIQYVFASRNNGAMGYLGLVSDFRFTIYNAYDDKLGNAERFLVWDNDLRFDKSLRALGKLKALDFENECSTFITATNQGWICVWHLGDKQLTRKFRLSYETPDGCDLLRDYFKETYIISYSNSSMNLYLTRAIPR